MYLLFTRQTKIFITEICSISKHRSSIAKVIFYCRFYFLGNISRYKYYGFRWKSQENLSSIRENPLKSSKIEIYSWPSRPYGKVWVPTFFIAFRLDSILNKQKIIKKIGFLVKMAKIVSFRPNHNIFNGFVGGSGKKIVYRNS
jgi:hypothetical protein